MYKRSIEGKIKEKLFKGKVICLYGPRRSGKTTLVKDILKEYGDKGYYMNCENSFDKKYLVEGDASLLYTFISNKKVVVLDEAQTVEHIGAILKLFVDMYPDIQIVATGSSSFDLANRIGDPLVGRAYEFYLYPFSVNELVHNIGKQKYLANIREYLVYGTYPAVVGDSTERISTLSNIANSYLYKDIFTFENIKKPKLLDDLLKLLAFQIGKEVSLNELAQRLEVTRATVERYIELLEKTYVVQRVYALRRNLRNEIKGNFKVYFYDLGVRNYIINSMNSIEIRDDVGALFENYFVIERIKYNREKNGYVPPSYFWRTYTQKEIDYVEESNGRFFAYECKWNDTKSLSKTVVDEFVGAYPNSEIKVVTPHTFLETFM